MLKYLEPLFVNFINNFLKINIQNKILQNHFYFTLALNDVF